MDADGEMFASRPSASLFFIQPGVDFSAAPLSGTVPLTVTFTNATGGAAPYLWDFGDEVTSTLVSPVHPYTRTGVYTISLAADGPGGSDTLTRTNYITVSSGLVYTTTHRVISYTYPSTPLRTGDSLYRLITATYRSTGGTASSTTESVRATP